VRFVRADRLVATLLILQAKGRITARALAEELEVSEKTARRDLEALGQAGIPVYSSPGRNGGWQLLGGARTDLSGLTSDEARKLFLAAGASGTLAGDLGGALRKLVRALPETFRADAEAAVNAVVVDPTAWGSGETPPEPRHLDVLQRCVIERRRVLLGYSDRTRAMSERAVDPLGLVSKGLVWYLVGNTDKGLRTFRLDRVQSLELTDEIVDRPAGFDLASAWRDVLVAVGERRTSVRATVRIDPRFVRGLRGQFGTDMLMAELDGPPDDKGRIEVVVGGPAAIIIAQHLCGWGSLVQVVEPQEVIDDLTRLAGEILATYGPTVGGSAL
jgi:predicted DNA-binding transcriptional regulator YafY